MSLPRRREFDLSLELVTPPVLADAYSVKDGGYRTLGGPERRYDAYIPQPARERPPPTVILVHGDGPAEFLREPRRWGKYRSWGALLAANGMAAIAFDHGSSEGRTRIPAVVAEIRALMAAVEREAEALGIDDSLMPGRSSAALAMNSGRSDAQVIAASRASSLLFATIFDRHYDAIVTSPAVSDPT